MKLALKEETELSSEVLSKVTLQARHLSMASPEQLMLLANQLGNHGRKQHGAGVAAVAATAFASKEKVREAEEAFLKAFALDPSNPDAAKGLAQAVSSAHERCDQLKEGYEDLQPKCKKLKKSHGKLKTSCHVLDAECKELRAKCKELREGNQELTQKWQVLKESNGELKATCQGLQKSWEEFKAKADMPRVELDSPMVWDLSTFDFAKKSLEFQLPAGVEADLRIRSHCGDVFLIVKKPVHVKGTVQLDSSEAQAFHVKAEPFTTIAKFERSKRPKSITLRIHSVQAEGSELRFG